MLDKEERCKLEGGGKGEDKIFIFFSTHTGGRE